MSVRSTVDGLEAATVRRWLQDLPPAGGYAVSARPLRYRTAPHLGAFCWYDDRLIELQVPVPFKAWDERVYHRAHRKPGRRLAFRWESRRIHFRTRRDVVRFLYCHEFYHWYLREVSGAEVGGRDRLRPLRPGALPPAPPGRGLGRRITWLRHPRIPPALPHRLGPS